MLVYVRCIWKGSLAIVYLRSSIDTALKVWIPSEGSIPEDEESKAVLSTRILASPLCHASVDKVWVICSASNHRVVGELLAWEVVGKTWSGSGLDVADESVAVSGDGWHDTGFGREWRSGADGEEKGKDGDEMEDVEASHGDGGRC